jgi:hypothetical protein
MTLRRRTGTTNAFTTAPVTGHMVAFSPQEVVGLVSQGDARVTILPDVGQDLIAPREKDTLLIDGRVWQIMGPPHALYSGATLAGWRLWVRGGGA